MPNREYIKEALEDMKITSAESLALWARRHGLLSVYIEFRPHTTFIPGAWQVIRPGQKTDPNTLAINKGRKTFTYGTLSEKHVAETAAKAWADHAFTNDGWRRIEGFGSTLFPNSVVEELTLYVPDLMSYENRQKSKYKVTKRK